MTPKWHSRQLEQHELELKYVGPNRTLNLQRLDSDNTDLGSISR